MTTKRIENFVMTVDPAKKADLAKLEIVRNTVKVSNKAVGTKLSVKCHGRLGTNNPNAVKYAGKRTSTIKLEDASRWDVYLFGSPTKAAKKTTKKTNVKKAASKR